MRGQTTGDLGHRGQQRQAVVAVGHSLIRDTGGAGREQVLRLRRIGGEVQIGKQGLPLAQAGAFIRLWLLDLYDHVGGKDRIDIPDLRPGGDIVGIRETCAQTGTRLDGDRMTAPGQGMDGGGRQADAVFTNFDFSRATDMHRNLR